MRKFDNPVKDLGYLLYRWLEPIADPVKIAKSVPGYLMYWRDWIRYAGLDGSEEIRFNDTYPRLHEKTETTTFDSHYFYQDLWAFKKIQQSRTEWHVDVGSRIDLIGFLTAITRVTFIDIRPLEASLDNFESKKGSILAMPYADGTIPSLSCLHVAEHVGLGRYGDPLDPLGTKKACAELSRTLAHNGNLYFSLPVGKARLCFNAHRIHSPQRILEYFHNLDLVEFSAIDDNGTFMRDIDMRRLENAHYSCGLFHFRKR